MSPRKPKSLVSLLYTQNPFYLISTCLFVYGLKVLFRPLNDSLLFESGSVAYIEPWGLLGSLAAVTLLMAVTAVLVVRWGNVWEDARSLVLIVLLMLLAIAVSCDELYVLLADRHQFQQTLFSSVVAGVLFSVAVCEFLIRCLRIRFSVLYRLPLYGFLCLFFAWPLLLIRELTGFSVIDTRCLVALFPTASALTTLTLVFAVRCGAKHVDDNGTPWSWPLFPWTPFVFIAIAVFLRSWFLSLSFDAIGSGSYFWDTVFGLYQFVPLVLAILLLLVEIGMTEQKPRLTRNVMLSAPLTLLLAVTDGVPWGHLPTYGQFVRFVTERFASPMLLTLMALGIFYTWAWARRMPGALFGLTCVWLVGCLLEPHEMGMSALRLSPHPVPLLLLGLTHSVVGLVEKRSLNFAFGFTLATQGALAIIGNGDSLPAATTGLHALLVAVVVSGLWFRDEAAAFFREISPPLLWIASVFGLSSLLAHGTAAGSLAAHVAAFGCAELLLFRATRQSGYLRALCWQASVTFVGCFAFAAQLPTGPRHLVFATLSFSVAVVISVLKSGLSRRIRFWWLTTNRSSAASTNAAALKN